MRVSRLRLLVPMFPLIMGTGALAQELPDGTGKALVQSACTQCHGIDVIVRQPRTRDEWTDVVSRMVGNGAQLSDEDYNQVIQYLATYLGPPRQNSPASLNSTAAAPSGKQDK